MAGCDQVEWAKNGGAMRVETTIVNPRFRGVPAVLRPGDEQAFGRSVGGVGRISEDQAVSRQHGIVHGTVDGFTVTSTGTRMGFVVADRTTPSKLHVPRGFGPVPVPFADCSIIVEHERGRDYVDITVSGSDLADRWAASWGPEMRNLLAAASAGAVLTLPPWQRVRWRKPNGTPYTWFDTLVALCEPTLGDAPAGTPTNPELAERLYRTEGIIERHLNAIYDAFHLEGGSRRRDIVAAIAVAQGFVTRADLQRLPARRR